MATTAPVQPESPADAVAASPLVVPVALVVSAGVIHGLAVGNHIADSWLRGAFFALAAVAQLSAGVWMHRRPDDRRPLAAAAVVSVAIALVWLFSRTTGLPFGVDGGKVEGVGVADSIATFEEVALAWLAVAILRRPPGPGRLAWLSSPSTLRVASAVLASALAVAALNGHKH